tara:strand:- start:1008 stop:1148 length:141 start_codon:yes stop_codon:yes gene_type:complete
MTPLLEELDDIILKIKEKMVNLNIENKRLRNKIKMMKKYILEIKPD